MGEFVDKWEEEENEEGGEGKKGRVSSGGARDGCEKGRKM